MYPTPMIIRRGSKHSTYVLGLNIPTTLDRVIEIIWILLGLSVFAVIPFGGWAFLIFFYFNWKLAIFYLAWIYYDGDTRNTAGRSSKWFRGLKVWAKFAEYFPLDLIKTADLDPSKNYLFCAHPHGLVCNGAFGSFATDGLGFSKLFPGLSAHLLTVEFYYWIPFTREFFLSLGACPATKQSMNYIMQYPGGGKVGVLMPGGIPEQLEARPNTDFVKLKSRKGFIKLVLQNGTALVPVYSFGENDVYRQIRNPEGSLVRKIQLFLIKAIGFYPPLANGQGILQKEFGPLPKRRPITTVVGGPIEVKQVDHPTQEQIDELHTTFINALKDLYYAHRVKAGYPNGEIKVI